MFGAKASARETAMLPNGWRQCRLGDLFENRRERGRPGLPLLSVTMNDGLVDREDLDRKQESALTPGEHLLVKPGDIAYNMMRMWQGAFGLATREGLVSPAYVVLKPKSGTEPEYAAQLLRTPRMLHSLWAYSYGLTDDRLRLYFPDFASIKVVIPPRNQQRRIALALSAWDQAISSTNLMAEAALQHRELLLEQLVVGHATGEAPQGRDRAFQLGDVIKSLAAGVSVNGYDRPAEPEEFGVLKISAVTSGVFIPTANKAIRAEEVDRARVNPKADSILVSRCNTAELLGASAYVDVDYPELFLPDKLWLLEPKSKDLIHMRWLAYWLAARATRTRISALATGSSGSMKNIAKDQFLALTLRVPPLSEQIRVASMLASWDATALNYRKQSRLLGLEKQALAQALMFGGQAARQEMSAV
jgi:type I restriction enzyme S subunit